MKHVNDLWASRLQDYNRELQKYLRYIFNGHLMFVLIFAVGGGGYAYSNWVSTLNEDFNAALIMAVIIGLIVTMSPIYTYLKEPDKVYLTPLEGQMKRYFVSAGVSSFFFQSYLVLIALAASMPMYVKVQGVGFSSFFLLLAIVLALKVWNLFVRWLVLKFQEISTHRIDMLIRLIMNIFFLWTVFARVSLWVPAAIALILAGYLIGFKRLTKKKTLKWELLIDLEHARLHRFYRFANLFTDVPHLKGQAKRRIWLDPFLKRSPFGPKFTYRYLYVRTFLRSDEYFGLWVRLTIIASVINIGSGNVWVKAAVAVLFLYLTGFQLIPMLKKHELKIWPDLYPIPSGYKNESFKGVLSTVLIVQGALFIVVSSWGGEWFDACVVAFACLLFYALFMYSYVPSQIKKWYSPLT
ncbi:ABC transporter permease [Jeotgalibacillus proteolyticus]|uniref:ABC transporter permease n=1 Tax=Jeotgalibacillus proteolyticus TaxID=2082395 RepID=A0A2S5GH68_9BACL|nr:ABC transporter permease [Jeotgalibacillus proteolyticus]PPA72402.1 ABC transporter permease [Jeotgalibacillus proteolyticus]